MRTILVIALAAMLIGLGYVAGTEGFGAAVVLMCLSMFTGIMLAIVDSITRSTRKDRTGSGEDQ